MDWIFEVKKKKESKRMEIILSFSHSFVYFWRLVLMIAQNLKWPIPKPCLILDYAESFILSVIYATCLKYSSLVRLLSHTCCHEHLLFLPQQLLLLWTTHPKSRRTCCEPTLMWASQVLAHVTTITLRWTLLTSFQTGKSKHRQTNKKKIRRSAHRIYA